MRGIRPTILKAANNLDSSPINTKARTPQFFGQSRASRGLTPFLMAIDRTRIL